MITFRGLFLQADVSRLKQLEDGPVWVPLEPWRPFLSTLRARLEPVVADDLLPRAYLDALDAALEEPDEPGWLAAAALHYLWLHLRLVLEPFVLPPVDPLVPLDTPSH